MYILIIDDDAIMRFLLRKFIERYIPDCFISEGCNGMEAVKLYKQLQPDLTFLDIDMPEKNGFYALRKIRMIASDAKIIMCTGNSSQEDVVEALRYKVIDYIIKPCTSERLLQALERADL